MNGTSARAWTPLAQPGSASATPVAIRGRRAESPVLPLAVGAAAVALPFVVVPAWYDAYYWPKVWVLYAAVAAGTFPLLRTEQASWLRCLGAPLGVAIAAWLCALAIATVLSVNPLLSFVGEDYRYEGLITWLAYGTLTALAARTLQPPRRLRAVLGATLAAAGVMSALGLLQHWGLPVVFEDAVRAGWARAWGTTGSPLALGAYLVLVFPPVLSLYAAEERDAHRLLYGALALVLYAGLIATLTRGVWGALGLGVAAWALAAGVANIRRAAGRLLTLAVLCAAVTPVVLLTGPPAALDHVSDPASATSRMFLWRTTVPLVLERPWFGWGPETLAQVYPAYGTPEFLRVFPQAATQRIVVDRPHGDLLQQAIATGCVGLAAYVWLCCTVLRTAWRTARARAYGDHGLRRTDDVRSSLVDPPVIGAGLFGGFAAYLAQLQLSFSYVSVAPLFWILVGAVAALRPRVAWDGAQAFRSTLSRRSSRVENTRAHGI